MGQNPQRRVVAELTKLWDQVVAKGKIMSETVNLEKLTSSASSQVSRLPLSPPSRQQFVQSVRHKVNTSMTAYEEFIGISQVKEAHSRVLQAEKNFLESQKERRDAQRDLTDVQNQLGVLRVEIDRTARGDDRYLELIKKEIGVIREERDVRSRFEELEKRERDLFSELSNALRFSHEKERAQNEKTKYWSVLGSIVGACLGIIGTTFNSQIKQQQTKAILSQTSSQVQEIQETVNSLANKGHSLSGPPISSTDIQQFINQLNTIYKDHLKELASERKVIEGATRGVESKLQNLLLALSYFERDGGMEAQVKPPPLLPLEDLQVDYEKLRPKDRYMIVGALSLAALIAITYNWY